MKKLLTVSLVAMMAVTTARAEIASKAYVDQQDRAVENIIGALSGLTTTEKNSVVGAINEVNTAVGNIPEQAQADWEQTTTTAADYIKNKPTLGALAAKDEVAESDLASTLATKINGKADASSLATVATTGDYDDLTDKPTLGTAAALDSTTTISENGAGLPTAGTVYSYVADAVAAEANVQADWEQTTTTADDYIKNKPTLGALAAKDEVAESDLASTLATKINGKQDELTFDSTPTANSTNPVTSGGVATALAGKADATDLSNYELLNNVKSKGAADTPVYFDASGVATPITSYAGKAATAGVADSATAVAWSGVQNTPTTLAGYGITDAQESLTFDSTPTANSTNPVTSGGVATALAGKADASSLATVATTGDYDDLTDKPTLGTAAAANVSTNGVAASESGLVTGDQVNTAINSANTTALDALDLTDAQATGDGVVTEVTQTNGQVAVTKADPLTTMNYDAFASGQDFGDGSYSLTMKVVSGTPTYKWELIERAEVE